LIAVLGKQYDSDACMAVNIVVEFIEVPLTPVTRLGECSTLSMRTNEELLFIILCCSALKVLVCCSSTRDISEFYFVDLLL
jgi:hypothetical protein